MKKVIFLVFGFSIFQVSVSLAQNLHYYFVEGVYQRSYFNPSLNNEGSVSIASGLGLDFSTNGPSLNDFIVKKPDGGLLLSAQNAIESMNTTNDILGYTSVNTFDASIKTPFGRLSAGHAWKANGWMEYNKDLAEFVTFGNGQFVGETLNLGPQINYINYNEIYIGLQKEIGPISFGARVKYLSGVEAIKTGNHEVDLTTSDDIYQITLESDFELSSSQAFTYTDFDDFSLNVENFSFDNILKNNTGWAFDLGASMNLGDRLELSVSVIDIGSITWDVDPKTYTSKGTQTFDGIDISQYITSEDEFVIVDSLKALLDVVETNEEFSTTLPATIYLGSRLKISDLWTVGAMIQSRGSGDSRSNVLGLNAMARLYPFLSTGILYSAKSGNPANLGLSIKVSIGPVIGFFSTDNLLKIGSFKSTNSNIRAGLSIKI